MTTSLGGLVASGVIHERILAAYPLLEAADLDALEAQARPE